MRHGDFDVEHVVAGSEQDVRYDLVVPLLELYRLEVPGQVVIAHDNPDAARAVLFTVVAYRGGLALDEIRISGVEALLVGHVKNQLCEAVEVRLAGAIRLNLVSEVPGVVITLHGSHGAAARQAGILERLIPLFQGIDVDEFAVTQGILVVHNGHLDAAACIAVGKNGPVIMRKTTCGVSIIAAPQHRLNPQLQIALCQDLVNGAFF